VFKLDEVKEDLVKAFRIEFMHSKVGKYIKPEKGDEQPVQKRKKVKNMGNSPQEMKRMR